MRIRAMEAKPVEFEARQRPGRTPLSARGAIALTIALGLLGGYTDLVFIILKKYAVNQEKYLWAGRDFLWTVPLAHVVLLWVPGVLLAGICLLGRGLVSLRFGSWLIGTLAFGGAVLRLPISGLATVVLAVGAGRASSDVMIAYFARRPRRARFALASLACLLGLLAAATTGWQSLQESRTLAALPATSPSARNVVFIVWDTVRAVNLSAYGYRRDTTPYLTAWARSGVQYRMAVAPAPWTYPSHSSFFTGRWPYQLDTQWNFTLDPAEPTLAQYLTAKGYQTAGFAANTNCCSYETGLDRGFTHFEDYVLTPLTLFARTVAGRWVVDHVLFPGNLYQRKWTRLQSRDASQVNDAFLGWLGRRRPDRPFFAFLNYFGAHDPYIPRPGFVGRFGIRPVPGRDLQVVYDFHQIDKTKLSVRDAMMVRDRYDDCISYLDAELGRLLATLKSQGMLENTVVVIASDHGEGFGDHGVFGHAAGLFLDQTAVPLVILGAGAPEGRVVFEPVSLRDLPATVVDLVGLSSGSPFPGHTLTDYWRLPAGEVPPGASPVLSEYVNRTAFEPQPGRGLARHGYQLALVDRNWHYIRDGGGAEQLYDWRLDPWEEQNLAETPGGRPVVAAFRKKLLAELIRNRGTPKVEHAYLGPCRQWLESLVSRPTVPSPDAQASRQKRSTGGS